ncbi:guanylate kinase [Ktedonobacter sp. SOSP1-52]|uniref:guanylate kinase n=1 Tax=Ktedonobacter sp. SOSP1-52 TaxID=2778366 RepID=UPI001915E239|nr:guanylate kinase [Ktedonobacter sp. SOSP1-52]GHO67321.1 guanylate kinase [Ktedonobacter sp. SOSP1-52]
MHIETGSTVPQPSDKSHLYTSHKRGLLFVLSAPSGTGKDTVIQALKAQGMDFHVVASVTTRAPRAGESEGNPYHFVNQDTFDQLVANDELLEYANVHGNWYGQPKQQIRDHLSQGRDVLLKIDVQGAATIRHKLSEAIFLFLVPGSFEELAYRLTRRQTETEDERQRRLLDAQTELAQRDHYDYVVENRQGYLDKAVEQVRAIILAEHCRTQPRYVTL